jgi:putative ribosome biogenesis GTPase RsgA
VGEPGRVVAVEANFCRVHLVSPGPEGQDHLLCTARARLAKGGLGICVGDWVEVALLLAFEGPCPFWA